MATMEDVAKLAEVSVTTVSHVLNDTRYVSPELTERVERAMEKLDYKPNEVARSLKTQRTATVGLIVSDISNPFFSTLVRGVEDVAAEREHSLIICNTDEDQEKEQLYIETLMRKKVDGLVIAPTGKNKELLQALHRDDLPFVFANRIVEGMEVDAVTSRNYEGAYEVTEHLIDQGHERIGMILGLERKYADEKRFEGYKAALRDHDIEVKSELIVRGDFRIEGGMLAAEELLDLKTPPSAIFAVNNQTMIGALKALTERDLNWNDISLVCFDDFEWIDFFHVPVITIAQQPYKMGERAAEILFEEIAYRNGEKGDTDGESRRGRDSAKVVKLDVNMKIRKATG